MPLQRNISFDGRTVTRIPAGILEIVKKKRRTACRDLALEFKIAFSADDDHGKRCRVLHAEYLLVEDFELVERLARLDGVDEQEALAVFHLLLPQDII